MERFSCISVFVIVLFSFSLKVSALKCPTCHGSNCNDGNVPVLDCEFVSLSLLQQFSKTDVLAQDSLTYGCLDVEFAGGSKDFRIKQCIVDTGINNKFCNNLREQYKIRRCYVTTEGFVEVLEKDELRAVDATERLNPGKLLPEATNLSDNSSSDPSNSSTTDSSASSSSDPPNSSTTDSSASSPSDSSASSTPDSSASSPTDSSASSPPDSSASSPPDSSASSPTDSSASSPPDSSASSPPDSSASSPPDSSASSPPDSSASSPPDSSASGPPDSSDNSPTDSSSDTPPSTTPSASLSQLSHNDIKSQILIIASIAFIFNFLF